ncbi:MAG: integral membrane transporter protein [Acidimicrobiaceae bacterium]|nr:MAG: integral membrane transporter protein [Acidimicrobiaceae bacterium]
MSDLRLPSTISLTAARPRWGAFSLVCVAYLVSTTGEQMLSPLFPTTSNDLGLSVSQGGIAFGVLTGAIAVTNLLGGLWLRRTGPVAVIRCSAVVGMAGGALTAAAGGYGMLLAGQVLLGAAAGLFFPAGLQAVGLAVGPTRRGFAMGLYGVAFSLGLTMAAALGALGAGVGWRSPFWVATALFSLAALTSSWIKIPTLPPGGADGRVRVREVLSEPTAVGSVLAVCQYGAIPFLTLFAVDRWSMTAANAATVLIVGRLLSIVAKVIGGASADRIGARVSARRTSIALTATGLAWVLLPGGPLAYALAAVFVGMVSSLGPVANMLAVERFGQNGMALGAYRSVQIGLGALASATLGLFADSVGLQPTLAAAMLVPLALLWICRDRSN